MRKRDVLQATTFGKRIAEEEGKELSSYFVETDQWQRIYAGEVDIVYGAKGSGKSAIYSLLLDREDSLFDRRILVIPAENPRGALVFKDLVADPPASEQEFRGLWKLYFLALVATHLRDYDIARDRSKRVIGPLEEAGLLPKESSLRNTLQGALDYVRNLFRVESLEGGVQLDPATGGPGGITGKITLREPSVADRACGFVSADELLGWADAALREAGLRAYPETVSLVKMSWAQARWTNAR